LGLRMRLLRQSSHLSPLRRLRTEYLFIVSFRQRIPIKTAKEIDRMRVAGSIAASILHQLAQAVKPGTTTGKIDALSVDLMRQNDCKSAFLGYRGFTGNICISVNEEVVHGIGGPRK